MTLILDKLPPAITQALELKAQQEGRDVLEVALAALETGLGLPPSSPKRRRDLSRFRGKWIEDPAFDKAIEQFESIDGDTLQ